MTTTTTANPTNTNTSNPTNTTTSGANASTSVSSNNANTITNNPSNANNASTTVISNNSNPNTNTNNNVASTSVSLNNTNANNSNAVNNSTTTVNVLNNIVVNIPFSLPTSTNNGGNNDNNHSQLNGNCSINPSNNVAVGQDISFFASASGGNGNYTYSWSGSDDLNSNNQSFTGRFYSAGNKYASVTISSNGQSITRSCNVNVTGSNTSLNVYCSATPTVANLNQYVTWTAYATGGDSNYYFNWNGSDGLYGSGSSITKQYGATGQKTATVTVTSNGQTYSASCNANINAINGYTSQASNVTLIKGTSDQVNPVSGIYLNQVPATGISMTWKIGLFAVGLLAWSAFAAFVVAKRKKLAVVGSSMNMVEAFKARNLERKSSF